MEIKITDEYVFNDKELNKIIRTYIQTIIYLALMGKVLQKHYDAKGLDVFSAPGIIERFLKNPKWDIMNTPLKELTAIKEISYPDETTVEELDKFIKSFIWESKTFQLN